MTTTLPTPNRAALDLTPTGKPCVICQAPAVVAHRPFCSERCRQVDLNRWLGGIYTVREETDDVVTTDPSQPLAPGPSHDAEDDWK